MLVFQRLFSSKSVVRLFLSSSDADLALAIRNRPSPNISELQEHLKNGQSTVGGPKWTRMDNVGPF